MTSTPTIPTILTQLLSDYNSRLNIHAASHILVSDPAVAAAVAHATAAIRSPSGPTLTIVSRPGPPTPPDLSSIPGGNCTLATPDALQMDSFTHAVFRVDAADDPKVVLEGLKRVVYALRPKGVAIVVHARVESGRVEEGGGSLQVALEDRMRFQSRGRVGGLEDVMYHAGFERGKIRRLRDEEGVEVVVGMKWDQLTA